MARDVTDGIQLLMPWAPVSASGGVPTEEEIEAALRDKARLAVFRRHRGCPPQIVDRCWENLYQEISARVLPRLLKFRHGGKYSLGEYCYFACCCALADIQRKNFPLSDSRLRPNARARLEALLSPQSQYYPLFDRRK